MPTELETKPTSEEEGKNTEIEGEDSEEETDPNPSPEKKEPPKTHTQADLDKVAAKARAEGRAAAKKDADEKRLQEQGEFQKLYEAAKPEAEKVPQLSERIIALEDRIHALIDSETENWPAEVKALDPGTEEGLDAREKWVTRSRSLAQLLLSRQTPPNPEAGNGAKGKPQSKKDPVKAVTDKYQYPGQTTTK